MNYPKFISKQLTLTILMIYLAGYTTCATRLLDLKSPVQMLRLINEAREGFSKNLSKLYLDKTLNIIAQSHSMDMVKRNFFNHTNPDSKTLNDRAKQMGFEYLVSENIGKGANIPEIHKSLMNSVEHFKNTMNPQWTRCGVGIYQKNNKQLYATVVFSVRDLKIHPVTENELTKVQTQLAKYILDSNKQLKEEDKGLSFIIKRWYKTGSSSKQTIIDFMKQSKSYNAGSFYLISKVKMDWSDNLIQKLKEGKFFKQGNLSLNRFGVNLKITNISAQMIAVFTSK